MPRRRSPNETASRDPQHAREIGSVAHARAADCNALRHGGFASVRARMRSDPEASAHPIGKRHECRSTHLGSTFMSMWRAKRRCSSAGTIPMPATTRTKLSIRIRCTTGMSLCEERLAFLRRSACRRNSCATRIEDFRGVIAARARGQSSVAGVRARLRVRPRRRSSS